MKQEEYLETIEKLHHHEQRELCIGLARALAHSFESMQIDPELGIAAMAKVIVNTITNAVINGRMPENAMSMLTEAMTSDYASLIKKKREEKGDKRGRKV